MQSYFQVRVSLKIRLNLGRKQQRDSNKPERKSDGEDSGSLRMIVNDELEKIRHFHFVFCQ